MRVVYCSNPHFLDHAFLQVQALSRLVELHFFLEICPESRQSNLLEIGKKDIPSGVLPGDALMKEWMPPGVRAYWQNAASFHVIVHNRRRSIHPASWRISHKAIRFIRDLRPDVVHLDDISFRLVWALPELKRIPLVVSLHDPKPHSGESTWRGDLTRRLTFGRAQQFILHNRALKESFCQDYRINPSLVEAIPLGILSIFRAWITDTIPADDRTVLFFGRLSPYKGLDIFFQAASLVAASVPGVRFIVAGRPITGYHIPPIPTLPNGGRIEIIEKYISNTQLSQLFQQATIVACPYLDATQSGVILTAYAFGRPVVATQVGGLSEYVEDGETGLLVPPRNPQALAGAIRKLLLDRSERLRMEKRISEKGAEELSWERIAEQTRDVYKKVI